VPQASARGGGGGAGVWWGREALESTVRPPAEVLSAGKACAQLSSEGPMESPPYQNITCLPVGWEAERRVNAQPCSCPYADVLFPQGAVATAADLHRYHGERSVCAHRQRRPWVEMPSLEVAKMGQAGVTKCIPPDGSVYAVCQSSRWGVRTGRVTASCKPASGVRHRMPSRRQNIKVRDASPARLNKRATAGR